MSDIAMDPWWTKKVTRILRKLPLFFGLYDEEFEELCRICTAIELDQGAEVFKEGETSHSMFVLLSGQIEIVTERNGRIYKVHVGETFGEIGMIARRKRTASAFVMVKSSLLQIGMDDFNRLLGRAPRISSILLRNITIALSQHIVRMNEHSTEYVPPSAMIAEHVAGGSET